MWMDVSQHNDGVQDPRNMSEDEDTVFDRTNPFYDSQIGLDKTSSMKPSPVRSLNNNISEHDLRPTESRERTFNDCDNRCGMLSWRPFFLQRFANKTIYSVLFAVTGLLQSSLWSYHTANMSTLEKRYRLDSVTSGSILFGNELAQVIIAIFFSHFKFRQHRGKMILLGAALSAFSCFLLASTHLLMGPGTMSMSLVKEVTYGTLIPADHAIVTPAKLVDMQNTSSSEHSALLISLTTPITTSTMLSTAGSPNLNTTKELHFSATVSIPTSTQATKKPSTGAAIAVQDHGHFDMKEDFHSLGNDEMTSVWPICQRDIEEYYEDFEKNVSNVCDDTPIFERSVAIGVIFTGNFILGIASMLFFLSGSIFSEDSTLLPNEIPRIFAITLSIKLIGSFFGYILAWSCLGQFVTLETPIQIDSRFLGAYWLGWLSLGLILFLLAFLLALFPGNFSRECLKKGSLTHDTGLSVSLLPHFVTYFGGSELKMSYPCPSILNVVSATKGLMRNRVYFLLVVSTMVHIFIALGFSTFLPKYLETMFRLRSNDAALLTGFSTVPFQVAGLMLSGAFIARYLPSPKEISHWSCIVTALQIVSLMAMSFLGCDSNKIDTSFSISGNDPANADHCSSDCNCALGPPLPLCDPQSGKVFYSPCHAGCEEIVNQTGIFSYCNCYSGSYHNLTLVEGYCQGDDCRNGLVAFLLFVCISQFLRGSTVVGRMMLSYKSLQADQRESIIGLTLLLSCLFAVIPSPFIFGSLFESACRVKADSNLCPLHSNEIANGNCWLYNDSALRFVFNLSLAAFLVVAFVLDSLLWRHKDLRDLRIYDGELRHLTTHSAHDDNTNNFSNVPL